MFSLAYPQICAIIITVSFRIIISDLESVILTLCDSMDCRLPGSSVHGIFQARILNWGAISHPRGFSRLKDQTIVSCIAGRFFNVWATREARF